MKNLQHRIQVNIAKKNGTKEAVVGSCIRRIPARLNHFIESGTKPMTCAVIAEKGFKCPRLEDGSCSCKVPAALCYQPMSVTGLRDIISGLTAAGDVVVDMQTAIEFVEEYLYNVDPATAGTIINYELKKVFKDFKAAERFVFSLQPKKLQVFTNYWTSVKSLVYAR